MVANCLSQEILNGHKYDLPRVVMVVEFVEQNTYNRFFWSYPSARMLTSLSKRMVKFNSTNGDTPYVQKWNFRPIGKRHKEVRKRRSENCLQCLYSWSFWPMRLRHIATWKQPFRLFSVWNNRGLQWGLPILCPIRKYHLSLVHRLYGWIAGRLQRFTLKHTSVLAIPKTPCVVHPLTVRMVLIQAYSALQLRLIPLCLQWLRGIAYTFFGQYIAAMYHVRIDSTDDIWRVLTITDSDGLQLFGPIKISHVSPANEQ